MAVGLAETWWPHAAALAALVSPLALLPAFHAALRRSLTPTRSIDGGTPADSGLPAGEVQLATRNGRRLFAWYAPAPGSRTAIVLIHGWGGNAAHLLPLAAPLHAAGHAVLLLDARCHGRSDDDSFASMPRFAEDLDAGIDWLRSRADGETPEIAVAGHSVGAAAALLAASRRHDIDAVVSLAAFAHPEEVMRRFIAARRIPFVPLGWYALRYVEWVIGYRFAAIAPENTIRRVRCPALLLHGTEDATVPPEDSRRLAARATGNARLLLLAGDHESIEAMDDAIRSIADFLAEALTAKSPPGT